MNLTTESWLLFAVCLVIIAFIVLLAMYMAEKKVNHRAYRREQLEETAEFELKPQKKRVEFSKIILMIVFLTYFVGFLVGVSVVWQHPELLGTLLTYIGAPTAVSVGFYSWKAKAENCLKMQTKAPEGTTLQDLSNIN